MYACIYILFTGFVIYFTNRTGLLENQLQEVRKNLKSVRLSVKDGSSPNASYLEQLQDLEAREKLINDKIKDAKNDEEVKQLNATVKPVATYSCDKCFRIIEGVCVCVRVCVCAHVCVHVCVCRKNSIVVQLHGCYCRLCVYNNNSHRRSYKNWGLRLKQFSIAKIESLKFREL